MLYNFGIFPMTSFIDLVMYQYGHEQCTPGHIFGPAARNHFVFHYVVSGTGKLYSEDTEGNDLEFTVRTGEGFLLIPGQVTTYVADKRLPWEYMWIECDGLRVKELLEMAGFSRNSLIYHAHSRELMLKMANEMKYITENGDEPALHLIGHLYLFFDYLLRSATRKRYETGSKLRDFYIKEALSYIEKNYRNDISVEDIAKNTGLNRSYFGRIFRDAIGESPQHFLLSYRMIKAAELLKLTELPIASVAEAVGYENALHFSRAFKNYYGSSPRSWRSVNRVPKVSDTFGK